MQYWFASSHRGVHTVGDARAGKGRRSRGLRRPRHVRPLRPRGFPTGRRRMPGCTSARSGRSTTSRSGPASRRSCTTTTPGVVAQAFMSLEELYPGRVFLGAGSGEAVNETPLGLDWPSYEEQRRRLETGLEAITRLWDGETVTDGRGLVQARRGEALDARRRSRPQALRVGRSARARAELAGRYGDGLWTLRRPRAGARRSSTPTASPAASTAARRARSSSKPASPGPTTSRPRSTERATGSRRSCPSSTSRTSPTRTTCSAAPTPQMTRRAVRARRASSIASDPAEHVERIREMERAGATVGLPAAHRPRRPARIDPYVRRAGPAGAARESDPRGGGRLTWSTPGAPRGHATSSI